MSVITPFYNTGRVFYETAKSILKQSFQQWEWLIINDASTDEDALQILEEFRNKDSRVRVIDHKKNSGLSAARNTGFKNAKTKYVLFIDSDDMIEPTTVEIWLWFLESYPEFSFVNGYIVGFDAQQYLWANGFESGEKFLKENLTQPTFLVRKEVFEITGGFDETNRGGIGGLGFLV